MTRTLPAYPGAAVPEVSYQPGIPAEAVALAFVAARNQTAGALAGYPAQRVVPPSNCAGAGHTVPAAFSRVVALPVMACERCGDDVVFVLMCKPCLRAEELRRRLTAKSLHRKRSVANAAIRSTQPRDERGNFVKASPA
jgi:hypothetical protein